ncbi:FAD-dependent oxidoreductase [Fulvivirgaceae bacterium BMA10]|uniref:FAD-dependent oxidoreductase n=1 Tax=Splendidivirga corallicola TaxID=3051826 RepID=A0ABT8KSR4_9BACT|nr:FAD-dependent oxidoreductase [Fulvivirgaceae bacterium BMA10]
MHKTISLSLSPKEAFNEALFESIVRSKLKSDGKQGISIRLRKRSIDARKKNIKVNIVADVFFNEDPPPLINYKKDFPNVSNAEQVIIVGMGPAGMFAALKLIEAGIKPVILERGKDVQSRRRDLAAINKQHLVNPESNYCFGEGGAGTYSDGKLYTRSKKRGDVQRILEVLVAHGATERILYESHPHIGTNKLPKVVADMRKSIIDAGGLILFNTKVTDLIVERTEIKGVITHDGERIEGAGVILATGHSARDIFELLHHKKISIEAKPFALGVRIEHAQNLIDNIQYHCSGERDMMLPASSYSLVQQVQTTNGQKGVFSFCMCPGGFIVPAATAPGEIVVNGMSPSRRDSKYANSGIVVSVENSDYPSFQKYGPLAGMYFQRDIEQKAWTIGGKTQAAPAQRMVDFLHKKISTSLLDTSYQPGLTSVDMTSVLPHFITEGLKKGFKGFGKKMPGYLTNEAQIIGVESRTSSPVMIPRDRDTLEHIQIKRLYPCGEGAGYAGGIVSAAMDGERCADAILDKYLSSRRKA